MDVFYKYFRVPEDVMTPGTIAITLKSKGEPEYALPYRKSEPPFSPYPKGGGVVCIVKLNGQPFEGVAVCSMSDNFCYRVGRNIAYGRALKKIEDYFIAQEETQ